MPTKRKRVLRAWEAPVSMGVIAFLEIGQYPPRPDFWTAFEVARSIGSLRDTWVCVRDELLEQWIDEHPGTRPWCWWKLDAPDWKENVPARVRPLLTEYNAVWELKQPRKRLGGIGTPTYEALNWIPSFDFGLPERFVSAFDVAYYNGRARGRDGNRIGTEYRPGHFPFHAIDPFNPPEYESQAAYLARYGFLSETEGRRLPADAFQPERVAPSHEQDEGVETRSPLARRADFPPVLRFERGRDD